jgi:hypothetical protein
MRWTNVVGARLGSRIGCANIVPTTSREKRRYVMKMSLTIPSVNQAPTPTGPRPAPTASGPSRPVTVPFPNPSRIIASAGSSPTATSASLASAHAGLEGLSQHAGSFMEQGKRASTTKTSCRFHLFLDTRFPVLNSRKSA